MNLEQLTRAYSEDTPVKLSDVLPYQNLLTVWCEHEITFVPLRDSDKGMLTGDMYFLFPETDFDIDKAVPLAGMHVYYKDTIKEIAKKFSDNLNGELGEDTLKDLATRSRDNAQNNVCETHEHCDANMSMLTAFEAVTGFEIDVQNETHTEIINKAWKQAQINKFYTQC